MKNLTLLFAWSIAAWTVPVQKSEAADSAFGETFQFMFFATIEGAYLDGLSSNDVSRVLMATEKGAYLHFIYACPLCMPVVNGLRAYHERPPLSGYKKMRSYQANEKTIGNGLSPDERKQLASDDVKDRLKVVNGLVKRWVEHRLAQMNLSPEGKEKWKKRLESARQEGEMMLKRFKTNNEMSWGAPGFIGLNKCAACEGANGMLFGL